MQLAETELAAKIVAWLTEQHWTVYQEVQPSRWGGGRADIVAVQGKIVWVIECKTTLSLAVIAQADRWQVHFRSVAVPRPKKPRGYAEQGMIEKVCRWLGLGIIEVGNRTGIRQVVAPPIKREHHKAALTLLGVLKPEHQTAAVAGSKAGGHWTPYRDTMQRVKDFLRGKQGASLKEVMGAVGKGHYASTASCRSNLRKCLEDYESEWCAVDKAVKPWRYSLRTVNSQKGPGTA